MRRFCEVSFVGMFMVCLLFAVWIAGAAEDTDAPRIVITPARALIDEPVTIVLRGFPAERSVTVRVRAADDLARTWESWAEFRTDREGAVALAASRPLSGTYQSADPAGLFWSMQSPPGDRKELGFPRDSLKPVTFDFTAEVEGKAAATAVLERLVVAPGVRRIPAHDRGLRGTFFVPAGKGPHPAILVLGGSGGGLREGTAAFMASKGYAALALAYFAYEDLPKSLERIPLEYFESAIRWLQARAEVRRDAIAVMGVSRGGELALLLGATFPQIGAVVANVPSSVLWGGVSADGQPPEQPAWTYRGKDLPFMKSDELTPEQQKRLAVLPPTMPVAYTPAFLVMLENPSLLDKAAIPVEKTRGPILIISGKDDQMWPSSLMGDMVMKRLAEARFSFPHRHLAYENGGHFIPLPNLPTTANSVFHPTAKMEMALGGSAPGTAAAAADSWRQTVEFLNAAFRK